MDEFNPYLSSGTGRSNMHDAGVGGHEQNCFAHLCPLCLPFSPRRGWPDLHNLEAEDESDRAGREIDCCGSSVSHLQGCTESSKILCSLFFPPGPSPILILWELGRPCKHISRPGIGYFVICFCHGMAWCGAWGGVSKGNRIGRRWRECKWLPGWKWGFQGESTARKEMRDAGGRTTPLPWEPSQKPTFEVRAQEEGMDARDQNASDGGSLFHVSSDWILWGPCLKSSRKKSTWQLGQ